MKPLPTSNAHVIMNDWVPEPGKSLVYDDSQTIDFDTVSLNGGFLLKTLLFFPFIRTCADVCGVAFAPEFELGKPISSGVIAVVIRSENETVKVGDHVLGKLNHQEYNIQSSLDNMFNIKDRYNLPWAVYLGAAGIPGFTACDVVFCHDWWRYIGPVGSIVILLAKAKGLKVIASAGSEKKVAFMKEIGADVLPFNYKTTDTREVLRKEGPIDM